MQKADLVHPGEIKEQKNINIMEDKSHLRKYLQHEAMPLVKKGEMLAGAGKHVLLAMKLSTYTSESPQILKEENSSLQDEMSHTK